MAYFSYPKTTCDAKFGVISQSLQSVNYQGVNPRCHANSSGQSHIITQTRASDDPSLPDNSKTQLVDDDI